MFFCCCVALLLFFLLIQTSVRGWIFFEKVEYSDMYWYYAQRVLIYEGEQKKLNSSSFLFCASCLEFRCLVLLLRHHSESTAQWRINFSGSTNFQFGPITPNPVTVAVCVSEILISSLTTVTTNQGLTTDNPFLDTFGCKDNNVDNNAVPYALRHECSPKAVGIASKTRLQLSPLRSLARKLEGGFPTCASFDEIENNCLFWFWNNCKCRPSFPCYPSSVGPMFITRRLGAARALSRRALRNPASAPSDSPQSTPLFTIPSRFSNNCEKLKQHHPSIPLPPGEACPTIRAGSSKNFKEFFFTGQGRKDRRAGCQQAWLCIFKLPLH